MRWHGSVGARGFSLISSAKSISHIATWSSREILLYWKRRQRDIIHTQRQGGDDAPRTALYHRCRGRQRDRCEPNSTTVKTDPRISEVSPVVVDGAIRAASS